MDTRGERGREREGGRERERGQKTHALVYMLTCVQIPWFHQLSIEKKNRKSKRGVLCALEFFVRPLLESHKG